MSGMAQAAGVRPDEDQSSTSSLLPNRGGAAGTGAPIMHTRTVIVSAASGGSLLLEGTDSARKEGDLGQAGASVLALPANIIMTPHIGIRSMSMGNHSA